MINPYEDYFSQSGHGLKVFVGSPHQRRPGIGTGVNLALNIATRKTPFREAFQNRFKESADCLKKKANEKINTLMEGSGYNVKKKCKKRHSFIKRQRKSTKKQKNLKKKGKKQRKKKTMKQTVEDIFS